MSRYRMHFPVFLWNSHPTHSVLAAADNQGAIIKRDTAVLTWITFCVALVATLKMRLSVHLT